MQLELTAADDSAQPDDRVGPFSCMHEGDSLELLCEDDSWQPDLIITDPPYAFGGEGDEHAISATVAVVLRECAQRLKRGGWMVIMCASSLRSEGYMLESVRGCGLTPVRRAAWVKPQSRTKVNAAGWRWASVSVLVLRKGRAKAEPVQLLDWIEAEPLRVGRRARVPDAVADWMVAPFVGCEAALDPFAGSGSLVAACWRAGIPALGFERRMEELHEQVERVDAE